MASREPNKVSKSVGKHKPSGVVSTWVSRSVSSCANLAGGSIPTLTQTPKSFYPGHRKRARAMPLVGIAPLFAPPFVASAVSTK